MKKRILFIDKSLRFGGVQTSLLGLLRAVSGEYDTDLLLLDPAGELFDRLPEDVHLIPAPPLLNALGMPLSDCLRRGTPSQKAFRLFSAAWSRTVDNRLPVSMAARSGRIPGDYDAVIAYHHEPGKHESTAGFIRIADRCVTAGRKIAWIHNDPEDDPGAERFNDPYYARADRIVCVSRAVAEKFVRLHPALGERVTVCSNFPDAARILRMSEEPRTLPWEPGTFVCFTACRLEEVKAIPRAVEAMAPVFREHPEIRWYLAGDGRDRPRIEETIRSAGLGESVKLLGSLTNPYPYLRHADLALLVSRAEAAPMLYTEAKLLGTPVFTTALASAEEMLTGWPATICPNSEEGIARAFWEIAENLDAVRMRKRAPAMGEESPEAQRKRFHEAVFGG